MANKIKIKKQKKVMIMELPKPEKPTGEDSVIAALMSLQATQGWAIILDILNGNIKYLEAAILDKKDPLTQEAIDEKEVEHLRDKRSLTIELRDTPANYIKKLQPDIDNKDQNSDDPYPKDSTELRAMENRGIRSLPTEQQ